MNAEHPLRVLALVPYPLDTAPGQRYRIEQWAPYLRDEGIDVQFAPFAGAALAKALYQRGHYVAKAWHMALALLKRVRTAWRADRFDVIYLYREAALVGPAWLERLASRANPRLMYDFDDAIWLHYVSPRNRYLSYLKAPRKTGVLCQMSAAVTVGNETLARFARRYNPRVTVIPSTVSLREYRRRPPSRTGDVPVIGWTGSHSSAQYLRVAEGALREVARRRDFRVLIIGLEQYRLDGVRVECRPWTAKTEVEDLWPMDIGIMPLVDDPWARGKCAMKAIQYMGVGLPAVVSPVGANRVVVEDGVTGFHAATESEWVRALERLLDDEDLRVRMGAEGRRRVEGEYSAEVHAPRVGALLKSLQR
jgi:glycosyltransferase involved in cell wall biosynthesis